MNHILTLLHLNLALLCLLLTPHNDQAYNSIYRSLADLVFLSYSSTYVMILTLSGMSPYINFPRQYHRTLTPPMHYAYLCNIFCNAFEAATLPPHIHTMFILSEPLPCFNQPLCRYPYTGYMIRPSSCFNKYYCTSRYILLVTLQLCWVRTYRFRINKFVELSSPYTTHTFVIPYTLPSNLTY